MLEVSKASSGDLLVELLGLLLLSLGNEMTNPKGDGIEEVLSLVEGHAAISPGDDE